MLGAIDMLPKEQRVAARERCRKMDMRRAALEAAKRLAAYAWERETRFARYMALWEQRIGAKA